MIYILLLTEDLLMVLTVMISVTLDKQCIYDALL